MAYIQLPGSTTMLNVNSVPDRCPGCHSEITPNYISSDFHQENGFKEYAILCSCPLPNCARVFEASYTWDVYANAWELAGIESGEEGMHESAASHAAGISGSFNIIYNQALKAEQENLPELSCLGYKKALECLVRDFLILKYPQDELSIRNSTVVVCINKYFEDETIKEITRRTFAPETDLGSGSQLMDNPEDLKKLVKIIGSWIEMNTAVAEPVIGKEY